MRLESEFTLARPDCPHPYYWHAADDESAELEVMELVVAFVRALQPENVLEAGACFGQTTEAIGKALRYNGHGTCFAIELDPDRAHDARERCQGLPVVVQVADALTYAPLARVDFLWLDTGQNRADELRALYPHLADRCLVGVHDTGPQHTVRGNLEPLIAEGLFRAIFLPTPRGVAFLEKTL